MESSKIFAKSLMMKYNIPTASFREFSRDSIDQAKEYLKDCKFPLVFKADGLASGKGVMIAENIIEGEEILKDFYEGNILNDAALNFIIEEFIEGEEVSVFAICDGSEFIVLPYSQDHKKISDGEKGKNTGGMGAVAPVKKFMTEDLNEKIISKIITPVLNALKSEGREYKGCLYCGLMIKDNEPYVIEFNCRFGDPETQAVLPLIKSDFLEMLYSASTKNLKNYVLEVNDLNTCCVVIASGGYPDKFETGKKISGTEELDDNCLLFHSGTKYGNDTDKEELVTAGGRVLSVVGISDTSPEEAIKSAYENVNKISFENKYFRKDIGFRIVNKNGV
ncbi:MAG: phosphoribosylamine--glycine ligase [Ignavibacteria bacterium]|nr:phosphoribosylamine--glycine ligase [Ignavibacteria bacterium]